MNTTNTTAPHRAHFNPEEWIVLGAILGIVWVLVIYFIYSCGVATFHRRDYNEIA